MCPPPLGLKCSKYTLDPLGLEHRVKSLKQLPLKLIISEWNQLFMISHGGFKKKNAISFEICPLIGLGSEEILFLL